MTDPAQAEREAAVGAMLPFVADHGWTTPALRRGLQAAGQDPAMAALLFNGPADMVEACMTRADRRMMDNYAASTPPARVSGRVRALVALRLAAAREERPALRRAMAVLALPGNAATAARCMARTVDAIWHTAGDRSADFNWYTKRGILAGVYGATVLYWLRLEPWDDPEDERALAFLDRRLAGVAGIGKLRGRAGAALGWLIPARLRENPPTAATSAEEIAPSGAD